MNTSAQAASAPAHPPGNHPKALALVLAALIISMANSTAPSPLYSLFQAQMGFDATTLTLIYAIYSAGVLLTLLSLGRVSDALPDRRMMMVPALVVVFIGALWIAAAHSVSGLIIGRLLSGFGNGALTGAASAALIELVPAAARKRAAMLATTAITAGCALGPAISAAALAMDLNPSRLPFILTALGALGTAIGLIRTPWPQNGNIVELVDKVAAEMPDAIVATEHQPPPADTMSAAPRPNDGFFATFNKPFLITSGALALGWAAGAFAMTMAPTLAETLMGIHNRTVIALLLCVLQIVTGISQVLSRHLAPKTALWAGTFVVALAMPACALAAWQGWAMVFSIATLMIGIGYGASFVGSAGIVNELAPSHRRASVVSLFYVIGYAGCAFPIMAFGAAADAFGMLPATGLFAIVSIGVAIVILRQARHLPVD